MSIKVPLVSIAMLLLLSLPMAAQVQRMEPKGATEGDLTFEDGTVINFKMLNNDPEVRANWWVLLSFIPMYLEKTVNLPLGLEGRVNLWDRAYLMGSTRAAWPLDFNMPLNTDYTWKRKLYHQHIIQTSVRISESLETRPSGIMLRQKVTGPNEITTYAVTGKAGVKKRYGIVGGLSYTQRRVNSDQFFDSADSGDTTSTGLGNYSYRPAGIRQRNLRLGVDLQLSTSFLVEVDGQKRLEYQESRFYGVVLLPVFQELDVLRTTRGGLLSDNESELVNQGYKSPGFTSLGWVMGFEGTNSWSTDKKSFVTIVVEVGILPGVNYGNVFKNFTASLGLKYGFGTNLYKKMEKEKPF